MTRTIRFSDSDFSVVVQRAPTTPEESSCIFYIIVFCPIGPKYALWSRSAEIHLNTTSSGAAVSSNVTNFQALIRLNTENFQFNTARGDGADIRFAKPDGTHLYYQIEQWDSLSQQAQIWVKIDTVYGNSSEALSDAAVLSVWDCTEPLITDQPDDDTVMLGHPAAFSVASTGLRLKYQWLRNNTVIENANGPDFTITTTHAYNNFDEFRVKVTTDCGSSL